MRDNKSSQTEHTLLQYRQPGRREPLDLVIGLDFGTSASKVVVQAPERKDILPVAVDFQQHSHSSMSILAPTKLVVHSNGRCTLPRKGDDSSDQASVIGDIKVDLFDRSRPLQSSRGPAHYNIDPESAAVAYMALLFRQARRWLLEFRSDVFRQHSKLNWSVNLGVPSPTTAAGKLQPEASQENERFGRVGKAAWMLSVVEGDITIEKAERELTYLNVECPHYWDDDPDGFVCDFGIVPEVVAAAIGYAQSDQRRDGVHIVVDVGAATVDVCSFRLNSAHDTDRYNLLTSDVKQLGTIRLHQSRIEAIGELHARLAQRLRDDHDPLVPIADELEKYLPSRDDLDDAVRRSISELSDDCQRVLGRVVYDLKVNRVPRQDPLWQRGNHLSVLLTGGGAAMTFYKDAIEALNEWLTGSYLENDGIRVTHVPIPNSLGRDDDERRRLAVAWGLSHRILDIGEVTPADCIPNIDPPKFVDRTDAFVSKDQV